MTHGRDDVEEWRSTEQPDAALLIDWENIKSSLSSRGMRPSIAAIRDTCEQYGRVVLARAYADWNDMWLRDDPRALYAAGVEPVYVPVRRYYEGEDTPETTKNSVDVRLAADCVELIHTHRQIQVFVLASGDQDFIHVVNKLRPYGKRVVGLAVSWSASPRLAELVDHMILYDRDIEPPRGLPAAARAAASEATSASRLQGIAGTIAAGEQVPPEAMTAVVQAVMRVLREYRESGREVNVSVLGIELQRLLEARMYSMVVRGRLQRIVRELARLGALQVETRGMDDWLYQPDEAIARPQERRTAEPPQPPRARLDWEELPEPVRRVAIGAVRALEDDPRLDYFTFNKIAEQLQSTLWSAGFGQDYDPRDVANAMRQAGVLLQDEERTWYDSFTGQTGTFWTLTLNIGHPEVQAETAQADETGSEERA